MPLQTRQCHVQLCTEGVSLFSVWESKNNATSAPSIPYTQCTFADFVQTLMILHILYTSIDCFIPHTCSLINATHNVEMILPVLIQTCIDQNTYLHVLYQILSRWSIDNNLLEPVHWTPPPLHKVSPCPPVRSHLYLQYTCPFMYYSNPTCKGNKTENGQRQQRHFLYENSLMFHIHIFQCLNC